MRITITQINQLLQEQHKAEISEGYNYVIFQIRTPKGLEEQVLQEIRTHRSEIEEGYKTLAKKGIKLQTYGAYVVSPGIVVVPIPYDCELNTLSEVLSWGDYPEGINLPNWS